MGGSSSEDGLRTAFAEGGEDGGVTSPCEGLGPGEHTGRCLLGMAAGVPRDDVLSVRCGGGVFGRSGSAGALATIVAILLSVQLWTLADTVGAAKRAKGIQSMD